MGVENKFVSISALMCEPTRARMLWNLLNGRAYTASGLSIVADISPTSASNHLSKLLEAKIIKVETQGRHRYYSLSNSDVAYVVEGLANLVNNGSPKSGKKQPEENGIKYCRTCYDHLAGKVGVLIANNLISHNIIKMQDKTFVVTENGHKFFRDFGLELDELQKQRRYFAKACLDWSERKYHLAGSLGAALLDKMLQLDWLRRVKNSRGIVITSLGQSGLRDIFKVER